jgi:hypothetical protein
MNFSKINLEHHVTLHVPLKDENLFKKYFQLTKVAIVSHVNFNFESLTYYEFNLFFAIEIKLVTLKT